jgi:hypothetical protein
VGIESFIVHLQLLNRNVAHNLHTHSHQAILACNFVFCTQILGFWEKTSGDSSSSARQRLHSDRDRRVVFCFPLPGETRYGRLRPPSRLKMNSLRSALTAVLARQTIQLSGKRETKHHELAQITVKILDSNRPSHGSPIHLKRCLGRV